MGHPVLSLTENRWKMRQPHDQNFPMEGKVFVEQTLASDERNKPKRAGLLRVTIRDPSGKLTI